MQCRVLVKEMMTFGQVCEYLARMLERDTVVVVEVPGRRTPRQRLRVAVIADRAAEPKPDGRPLVITDRWPCWPSTDEVDRDDSASSSGRE